MAMASQLFDPSSSSGCSGSSGDVPVQKWTCTALKSWLKARGLSYSGLKKDQLVAKLGNTVNNNT